MGYCDYTTAWLRDLTRQRRRKTIRVSAKSYEHKPPTPKKPPPDIRRRKYLSVKRAWWSIGRRYCEYCQCELTRNMGKPNTMTVDHKTPLSRGGTNDPHNLCPACVTCNGKKADMLEGDFRALIADQPSENRPSILIPARHAGQATG